MNFIKNEWRIFLTAVMFYTRIPCPAWVGYSEERLNQSSRYFPLVGLVVGGLTAAVFAAAHLVFPMPVAVLLSLMAGIYATGAFHEDGLADFFDGFGGGWEKADILKIMKDSRVGTYGVIGLGMMVALKFLLLNAIGPALVPSALIAGHSLSRFFAGSFLVTHDYVREDRLSKVKPLATHMSRRTLAVSALWCLLPLPGLISWGLAYGLGIMLLIRYLMGRYLLKRIGGYTGDCLGAAQQMLEVGFYLGMALRWS